MQEKQYIICSAIHYQDGKKYEHQPKNVKSGFVVCGRRHHNCINTAFMISEELKKIKNVQGFLTNTDHFVDRKQAYRIAKQAKQLLLNYESKSKILLSEDIY